MGQDILEFCDDCGEEFNVNDLSEDGEHLLCKDCFVPLCKQCENPLDDDVDFCSHDCYKEYWADIMEDDYKEQYKNR